MSTQVVEDSLSDAVTLIEFPVVTITEGGIEIEDQVIFRPRPRSFCASVKRDPLAPSPAGIYLTTNRMRAQSATVKDWKAFAAAIMHNTSYTPSAQFAPSRNLKVPDASAQNASAAPGEVEHGTDRGEKDDGNSLANDSDPQHSSTLRATSSSSNDTFSLPMAGTSGTRVPVPSAEATVIPLQVLHSDKTTNTVHLSIFPAREATGADNIP
ncbi:hypothetical protein Moror_16950 [Moniliophthora roreri MCA 2997]|uniref:Uncharacterized protein n=2 Tax=Moniliophthora roreri TaxID=221103 RepID=V2WBN8_MONRO|nr:hypothetical protein Moror_16950 [Moniliophthora roreri MCA 2997]KAI3603355.1 hypothetical protein WG66_002320 [Moniliophthora roreri]